MRRAATALLGVLVGSVALSGCDFDVYSLPLPGGTDVGDHPIEVTVQFQDVLDLVPKSTVKVNDVSVGQVKSIDLEGYHANVEIELRDDTKLPENTVAEIRQTSLLGEKFVSLAAPESGAEGSLETGDVIPLERTGRNPEVEEVLGALSLILNGGGVAQLKTITQELNKALSGREGDVRSVLDQVNTFTSTLDTNKVQIVDALEALNRLSISARQQEDNIDEALEQLPSALTSIDGQRQDLVKMLQALDDLSGVGVQVISASKDATINSLRQLQPVLNQLAASGDDLVNAVNVFYAYPFVDEVVGRDPQVARNLHMGDYTNLSIELQLDLTKGLPTVPGIPTELVCTPLSQIPDLGPLPPLDQLCADTIAAINKCTQSPSLKNCKDLPDFLIKQVCQALPVPIPLLCNGLGLNLGGGGGGSGVPLPSLPTLPLPSVSGLPDLGGVVGGVLGGLGRAGTGWNDATHGGPTMAQLQQVYDPALVNLLIPPSVVPTQQPAAEPAADGSTQAKAGASR
ncbi:MCE family protein [Nocardioides anomalus]|nr:MCE family protein [Nocardioides anomalus]